MIRESTTLERDVRAAARRTRGWTIALAALAVAVGLVIGLLLGLNWPDAPAAMSLEPQPALTGVGEVAHPDDYLARYLTRHQSTATQPIEAPADDYLARYLTRHQPMATQPSGHPPTTTSPDTWTVTGTTTTP